MTSAGHHVMLEGASAPPAPAYWGLCFTAEEPNVVVNMSKTGSPPAVTLETSTDGETWTAFDADGGTTPVTLAAIGDHVFFRAGTAGNSRMSSGASACRSFTLSGRCSASGSVMSLLSASDPDMSFTTATTGTYALAWLFDGCATLTSAPMLTSKSTRSNCYRYMFRGCTSLRRAPRLAAYDLSSNTAAYYGMFDGCSSLELVEVLVVPPGSWTGMFANFVSTSGASRLTIRTLEASADEIEPYLQEGWTLETIPHPFAVVSTASISISCVAELMVSTDLGDSWTTYSAGSSVSLSARRVAMFRATAEAVPAASSRHVTIPSGSSVVIAGELTTLVTKSGDVSSLPTGCFANEFRYTGTIATTYRLRAGYLRLPSFVSSSCFSGMFVSRTDLTVPPRILPATTLAERCYESMFSGCTKLTVAPVISATTMAGYCCRYMFSGCTSLTTAPALPATTLAEYCYYCMFRNCTALTATPAVSVTDMADYCCVQMFEGCTSLTTASAVSAAANMATYCCERMFYGCTNLTTASAVSATNMATHCCEEMFSGCTALTAAPVLPATTLANSCYRQMFEGCTSLTAAPAVPATTLEGSCYYDMFSGCTALTTAPALPATTLAEYCYFGMFRNCTALTAAPELPATTLAYYCYQLMFRGCTSLTTAPALPATTLAESCYLQMFQGCTSLTTAPALPATTLASYCYYNMFSGCTSLVAAPELPATTLASDCYRQMFQGCTSLVNIKAHFSAWGAQTTNWVDAVAASGVFECPAALPHTESDFSASKIPPGWTVETF